MGLDIYFHRIKRIRKSKNDVMPSIEECSKIADKRAKDRVRKTLKKLLSDLKTSGSSENYSEVYHNFFPNKAKKITNYDFKYSKMLESVKPLSEVEEWAKNILRWTYAESDAYFRKVNFVYRYFSPKLENEACFVTRYDLEDLIRRCEMVLNNEGAAEELLPTQSGFFFGSTDYDNYYYADVEDCKKQMKKLLKGLNEDTDAIYVVMSW